MNIQISVDSKWLLSGNGRYANTIRSLIMELSQKWGSQFEKQESSINDCRIVFNGDLDVQSVSRDIADALKCVAGDETNDGVFHINIEADGKKYSVTKNGTPQETDDASDLFSQINALRKQNSKDNHDSAAAPVEKVLKSAEISHPTDAAVSSAQDSRKKETHEESPTVPDQRYEAEGPEKETDVEEHSPDTYELIQGLVGSKAFKQLAEDIKGSSEHIIRHKTQELFFSEAYLFSVDTGCGYHSSLSLLNNLLNDTGLFVNAARPESLTLPPYGDNDTSAKMSNFSSALESILSKQRLITIDISEWLGHTHSSDFKKMIMQLFRTNDKCAVVFRIPYVRQGMLDSTTKDLSDIISIHPVVFEPFTPAELKELAQRCLDKYGFTFTDKAWDVFNQQIDEEKADGYFYGIHTVRKLVGEIIRKKELISSRTGDCTTIISDEIAPSLKQSAKETASENLDTLRSMIGMETVTNKIIEIVNQIVYSKSSKTSSKPTMHMCFVGNPGTGKTTVARILGNILKEKGILRIGKFHEHHGRDLCGEYVGHTAPKTRAIVREAYGSVLFIDEAYSLASGGERYDYGREAIDTLITEMENHADDLIVIFAGYPDEIARMISLNPGMKSRIPYTIEFPNYTRKQLSDMFMKMIESSFVCTNDLEEHARKFFESIPDTVLESRTFGNGRFVRNLFERTWGKAVSRNGESGLNEITISGEDFDAATKEFNNKTDDLNKRKIGF